MLINPDVLKNSDVGRKVSDTVEMLDMSKASQAPLMLAALFLFAVTLGCDTVDEPVRYASPGATTGCHNGRIDPGEVCDGVNLGQATCILAGFTGGTLACSGNCLAFDYSGCDAPSTCTNNGVQTPELCDGADLNGQTCTSLGRGTGTLLCNDACTGFVTTGCTGNTCVPDCTGKVCGPNGCGGTCAPGCGANEDCDDSGLCIGVNDPNGPMIVSFNTNTSSITQGESVIFTAVVTDPDGVADVIGGTLVDTTSGNTYGAFTATAISSYTITVSWAAIHQARAIEFLSTDTRNFRAIFHDQGGHQASAQAIVTLTCGGDPACSGACGFSRCSGSCVDLQANVNHCGACSNVCGSGAWCDVGTCKCTDSSETVCPVLGCVNLDGDVENCGTCGNDCVPGAWCNNGTCECPADEMECPSVGCVEPEYDDNHCGGCGIACSEGDSCYHGNCSCGSSGTCPGTQTCLETFCFEVGDTLLGDDPAVRTGMPKVVLSGEAIDLCYSANTAAVVCRELFGSTLASINEQTPWVGPWYVHAGCNGTEARVADCVMYPYDCAALMYIVCNEPDVVGPPVSWVCNTSYYNALDGCDCNCGAYDPDCDIAGQDVYNCTNYTNPQCDSSGNCQNG